MFIVQGQFCSQGTLSSSSVFILLGWSKIFQYNAFDTSVFIFIFIFCERYIFFTPLLYLFYLNFYVAFLFLVHILLDYIPFYFNSFLFFHFLFFSLNLYLFFPFYRIHSNFWYSAVCIYKRMEDSLKTKINCS